MMAQALNKAGHSIIAFAPAENNSAAGMRINLMQPMALRPRNDLKSEWGLDESKGLVKLFELDGTPCDTDNEWTFVEDASDGAFTGYISHQRADNSRHTWDYNKGTQDGDDADVGSLGTRVQVAQ